MSFADELAQAQADVTKRLNERLAKGAVPGSVEEAEIEDDRLRLSLLANLGELSKDPKRAQAISDATAAQMALNKHDINATSDQARGRATMQAAANGMLGSGSHQVDQGKVEAGRVGAINQAASSIADWEQQRKDANDYDLGDRLMNIIKPTNAQKSALEISQQSQQVNLGLAEKLRQVQQSTNGLLLNSLGKFLDYGVTPTVSAVTNANRQQNLDAINAERVNRDAFISNPTQNGLAPARQRVSYFQTLFG